MTAPDFGAIGPADLLVDHTPAGAVEAGVVRRALVEWLAATSVDEYTRADVTLAVYEAMANVIQHAYRHTGEVGTMSVRARYAADAQTLEVTVTDTGKWIDPVFDPRRGLGLPLIETLATNTVIGRTDHGTTVSMRWIVSPGR